MRKANDAAEAFEKLAKAIKRCNIIFALMGNQYEEIKYRHNEHTKNVRSSKKKNKGHQ